MAPIVFGPIRPSTASAGAGPPQEGGTRFSISWMVLMSLLRLAPPSPTEAEIVRGMETSPSAHRIHLRGQLQHRVEAHLLAFRAEVEQAVDVEAQRAFVGSLLLQGHAHSRQSLLVQRDRALQRAPDAVAVVRAAQPERRIVGHAIRQQRACTFLEHARDQPTAFHRTFEKRTPVPDPAWRQWVAGTLASRETRQGEATEGERSERWA